ncbi:MAG: AI-2E family transporter [Proteobacteria bacterium]|nr:AI-2E family transporter [Pseudomonadota bacterium]
MNLVTDWFKRQISDPQLVLLALLLLGALAGIILLGDMVAPAIAALVIAFLLDGPASWLRARGMSNLLAVSVVFVTFVTISFVAFFTILPPIKNQFTQFFVLLPTMLEQAQVAAINLSEAFPGWINETQMESMLAQIGTGLQTEARGFLASSPGVIITLISIVVYVILVPVMAFFFMKDRALILRWLGAYLPAERSLVKEVWAEVMQRTGDYARGKVYEIFIVGFSSWALYMVLDLRFAAFLALLTGLSVIIPYIGAAVITLPVAFVAYIQWGTGHEFVVALVAYLVLQALDGYVLVPLLFSEVVKLHPNAIILAILIFGGIWGIWGVFFAIPLATLAHAVTKAWRAHLAAPPQADKA